MLTHPSGKSGSWAPAEAPAEPHMAKTAPGNIYSVPAQQHPSFVSRSGGAFWDSVGELGR